MDFPVDMFLKPVADTDDLFAFSVGGKALGEESISVQENGDLIIEGYAAVWDGDDRQGENFVPGAFSRAAKAFIASGGPLCFHHKADHVLGSVTDLHENEHGLKFRARVDGAIQKNPALATIYEQIKKGTLKGVSVGGFFKRALIAGKQKIADVDFTEISVTGVPMHTGPSFAVVAGKALTKDLTIPETVIPDAESIRKDDFEELQAAMNALDKVLQRIGQRRENNTETPTDDSAVAV